jgi:glutamate/tyrosine decarboxylase-like PLP-dependent enzyme
MADSTPIAFPAHGTAPDELLAELGASRADDLGWREGRAFSLVYNSGDHEHERLLEAVARSYQHDNALNPFAYPSLLRIELELVAMAADLFGAPADAGAITSGGTESIFLAVQTARDQARAERGIAEPRLVTPITAHPAFAKAAHYLDVEHVLVPVGTDGRVDLDALADTVDDRTGLVVASAPNYPYGVIDDVAAVAALAAERGVLCHVDACLGGWLLPWWERLGEPVPPWDLRVPGVTSLSADLHKYGYTFKGASVILYRDRALLKHQHFWYDTWPGGLYASGTTAGTRPAPPIAGAWYAVRHLGADGYLRLAGQVREATQRFRAGIEAQPRLRITHPPDLSLFEFTADDGSIGAIGDGMAARGWHLDRQQGGLHLMLSPYHLQIADEFLADLTAAVDEAPAGPRGDEPTPTYGGIA